jgi:uncharacterized membrane protein YhaH (DUF805 family)
MPTYAAASAWGRPLGRAPYFLIGVTALAVKHVLDWGVASVAFGREWPVTGYFILPEPVARIPTLPAGDRVFYATLLGIALPFIAFGVLLTVRRLRDAGLPAWLVVLFFVPLVNFLFFLLLSLLPRRPADEPADAIIPDGVGGPTPAPAVGDPGAYRAVLDSERDSEHWRRLRSAHRRVTRERPAASAAVSLAISVPLAVGAVALATLGLGSYGAGLFVGVPFALGMVSVVLYGLTRPQPLGACLAVAFWAATLAGLLLLLLALEGAICLLMASPIWYALVMLGALVGYAVQARPWAASHGPLLLLGLLVTLPGLLAAESATGVPPPVWEVTSAVEVDAPPEAVWRQVVSFPPLPEPDDWAFRAGVAYPVRAEIAGRDPGAVRRCVFSTGAFVEPIDVWDEPRRLAFRVEEQPEPMREWSPYAIHPPHLHGYLVSRRGEFRLVPLPGGRTLLEGTTWYTNDMAPAAYWRLWSDAIIHRIHLRVLRHVKALAEADAVGRTSSE